jgi:hypothetical protein
MSQSSSKQIFFHVGLGKTASTYLQYRVFPYFKNIEYIHHLHRYKNAAKIVSKGKSERYLISREFDLQMESEVSKFAAYHPDTTAIIVFRRQDSWVASQYRRFVKNGYAVPFSKFFDLENDKGMFKQIDLKFYHYIEILEKYFTKKPIVLFYDDMREDPIAFFDYIAQQIGVDYDKKDINLKVKHSSYNEKQLKAIMRVSKKVDIRRHHLKRRFYLFNRFYTNMIRYSTLFIGKYLSDAYLGTEPLINPDELKAVRDFYEDDWQAIVEYAQKNNSSR